MAALILGGVSGWLSLRGKVTESGTVDDAGTIEPHKPSPAALPVPVKPGGRRPGSGNRPETAQAITPDVPATKSAAASPAPSAGGRIQAVEDGKLTPEISAFLGMNEAEISKVEAAISSTMARVAAIALDTMFRPTNASAADGTGTYVIPPFREQGAAEYQSLKDSIRSCIGDARANEIFAALDAFPPPGLLSFGNSTISIEFLPADETGFSTRITSETDFGHSSSVHSGLPAEFRFLFK